MLKNEQQFRAAEFRADSVNEEARTAEFVISTEAVDTYGTVFLAAGWELERYNRNPVVTYQHKDNSDNPDLVIGTSVVRLEDKKLIATMTFEAAEDNPLAEKVFRKVKNGILRGASIHAQPFDGRWGEKDAGEDADVLYFTRTELRAWSIVTVQSNPEALSRNNEDLENIKKEIVRKIPVVDPQEINTTNKMRHVDAQILINKNSQ